MRLGVVIVFASMSFAAASAVAADGRAKGEKAKTGAGATDKAKEKTGGARAATTATTSAPVKKERVIDFTREEEIRGVLTKPEAELVGARRKVQSKSLLPIRLHFIPEMMKTVQDL